MNSFLTALALTGFFAGFVLYFFLSWFVLRRGQSGRLKISLLALLISLQIWFGGNFLALMLRQMAIGKVESALGIVDLISFSGLAVLPALLMQTHWDYFRQTRHPARRPTWVTLSLSLLYIPLLGLPLAWRGLVPATEVHPIQKLGHFSIPFLTMLAIAYCASAVLQIQMLRRDPKPVEQKLFSKLVFLFLVIPWMNFIIFADAANQQTGWGVLWVQLALLSSLLPGVLVSYYVYRHGFLQIAVERGLSSLLLILLTLSFYLLGVRRLALFLQQELQAPPLMVEGIFLAAVLLLFPTLSRFLENYTSRLFSGQIERYRMLAQSIGRATTERLNPPLLRDFIQETLQRELHAEEVKIHLNTAPEAGPDDAIYPLQAGGRRIGWLRVSGWTDEATPKEALGVVANEIALLLERSRLIESRIALQTELARKSHMAELGQMASTVAHNVKNPLSSMKTLLQLMTEADNLSADQKSELTMVLSEVDRLSETVSNLLKFSGLEARSGDRPQYSEVHLGQLIETVGLIFKGELQSRGLQLSTEVRSDVEPVVLTDQHALSEILENLVSNALEACQSGGQVSIAVEGTGEQFQILVADSGSGVSSRLSRRIFKPFVTTKARGTGLGLAIVKRRVQQLGGRIRLRSNRPKGSIFVVSLPAMSPAETILAKTKVENEDTHSRRRTKRPLRDAQGSSG